MTRIKILSEMDITERRLPQDGRFKFKVHGRIIDVRVSALPEVHSQKIVLRLLDRASLLVDMHDIGMDDVMLERFRRILKMPHGIILTCRCTWKPLSGVLSSPWSLSTTRSWGSAIGFGGLASLCHWRRSGGVQQSSGDKTGCPLVRGIKR